MSSWLERRTLPILRGPLAGKRWLISSRINFFLGTYEPEQTQAFQEIVRPGHVVYDVGAHYGYYTLLASALAGPAGKVFAFEPSPANIPRLQLHLRVNRCANVTIEEMALSDHEGKARFDNQTGSGTGHLSPDGMVEVQTATLDALSARLPTPDVLKIDCEGAELQVLSGGEETIRSAQPAIFLSTHSPQLKADCFRLLGSWGYRCSVLRADDSLHLANKPERQP
jgi:FkbM family methyltransferase